MGHLHARPDPQRPAVGTSAPRVLLVETLDAIGSDRADARDRCAALRGLHAVVRVAILSPARNGAPVGAAAAIATPGAFAEWDTGPSGLGQLRAFAREGRFDHILVASAADGGGTAARALPPGVPATWWPTGVSPAAGWRARFGFGRAGGLPALGGAGSDAGFAWSSVAHVAPGRRRLTLWDGEYLLAPLPLAGDDGSRLLAAFAGLGDEWCGVDLVVLGEPGSGFEREARARGIGPRVHFVGLAPREAEAAWWSHASGAVFAGAGPIAGGFVLRGLDAGCPIAVLQSDVPGTALRAWLDRNGCVAPPGDDAAGLARLLERGPEVAAAVARGRALAREQGWERTTARLTAALPGLAGPARPRRSAAA
jgi:hypothetical protein